MSVQQKAPEMKQLIDRQMNEILDEVQTVKQTVTKDVLSLRQSLETSLVAVESFTAYSKELRKKGKPCDLTKAASKLHNRAVELQNMPIAAVDNCVPKVVFKPTDVRKISGVLGAASSLIGVLAVTKSSSGNHIQCVVSVCK